MWFQKVLIYLVEPHRFAFMVQNVKAGRVFLSKILVCVYVWGGQPPPWADNFLPPSFGIQCGRGFFRPFLMGRNRMGKLDLPLWWGGKLPQNQIYHKQYLDINNFIQFHSISTLTLPTLGFFENGSLGGGSKWPPPLKIFNKVKTLKLVPNLGNHTNFSKLHPKKFCDKIFWWRQYFLAKSGKFRSKFQKFVIF